MFEYKWITLYYRDRGAPGNPGYDDYLTEFGRAGWEIIHVEDAETGMRYFMKRQILA